MKPNYRRVGQGPHTPGPWHEGTNDGAVVSDNPTTRWDLEACKDHPEMDKARLSEVDYYGGYIIAESILPEDRPLIAAAPDLLAAVMGAVDFLASGIGTKDETIGTLWEAYKKATGVCNG